MAFVDHCINCTDAEQRGYDRAVAESADLLTWLETQPQLELRFEGWEGDEWQVHAVHGGRNDREWKLISEAKTPLSALRSARAALTGNHRTGEA